MPDLPAKACPFLREELATLAAQCRLPIDFGPQRCPCSEAPGARGRDGAWPLRCAGVAPGGPETCFHLVAPAALVDGLLAAGAHLVTPGWLRAWRDHLEGMGLAEPAAARALVGEAARRVVLLDTGLGPDAAGPLAAFAAHLGLPAERIRVGLDHLRLRVDLCATERRAQRAEQRAADEAALLDALASLAPRDEEAAVVARFRALLVLLLAPARVAWQPVVDGRPGEVALEGEGEPGPLAAALRALDGGGEPPPVAGGLLLRIGPPGEEVGRLGCEGVQFPEHLDRYRELAPILAHAFYLSLSRARAMETLRRRRDELDEAVAARTADLRRTVAEREAALEKAHLLSGLIPICFGCKKIRDDAGYWTQLEVYISEHSDATFSHGLCEDCLKRLYPDV